MIRYLTPKSDSNRCYHSGQSGPVSNGNERGTPHFLKLLSWSFVIRASFVLYSRHSFSWVKLLQDKETKKIKKWSIRIKKTSIQHIAAYNWIWWRSSYSGSLGSVIYPSLPLLPCRLWPVQMTLIHPFINQFYCLTSKL